MLLYRHFRLKKYNEPIPIDRNPNSDDLEDMFKDDEDMLAKIQNMLNKKLEYAPIPEVKEFEPTNLSGVDEISDFGSEDNNNNTTVYSKGTVASKAEA